MVEEDVKQPPLIEEDVSKLRRALRHWQTLELDYEGLKDEIQGLSEDKTTKIQLFQAAHDFAPEKLDDKDLDELFQVSGKLRRPSQIVEILTKRAEYVRKNIETLRKQLTGLEKERNTMLLASRDQKHSELETDLSQADITEELDENGNVVSSLVQRADDPTPEKMKIDDARTLPESVNTLPARPKKVQNSVNSSKNHTNGNLVEDKSIDESTFDGTHAERLNGTILQPVNSGDTEEEANLRQEMLQYGLPEVGNIVAELEMADAVEDEDEDDLDDSDDYDDDYDDSEEEESEDEHGRSTRSTITDKYHRKMEKLQKEMGLSMENVGPSPETTEHIDRPPAAEAARKAAIARHEAAKSAIENNDELHSEPIKNKARKKVAFAGSLDIASSTSRQETAPDNGTETKQRKISRFKAARSAQPQTPLLPPPMDFPKPAEDAHEGRAGRIVAETLVERSKSPNQPDPAAPDGDDFDEEMQKRQIALEHYRLRNKKIHEQGGYIGGGELDNWGEEHAAPTVLDEKTGQPRKVSRFKAARLKG